MTRTVSNSEDILDSRDIIARIEELESERDDLAYTLEGAEEDKEKTEAETVLKEWDEENADELKALKSLQNEAEGYSEDWRHGAALIRDSYFEDYARSFAEDIGAIKRDMDWPCNCIDWAEAADQLKQDYTEVDFDGVAYWVR